MPYRVYLEDGVLRLELSGMVSKSDLVAALRETESLEKSLAVTPHRITDLTGWDTSENFFPEILAAANQRKARTFANTFKSAMVADKPAVMGSARMFQTLNDHPLITIRIFPDLAAAKAWLAEG